MQLFIVQFNAVHPLFFRTLNTERSNVQPITGLPLSRTATCFGLNRPSTQRSKPISKCNTYLLNIYIAFSVLDHSSVQSVVISSWQLQNCSVRPNVICTGTVKVLGSVIKLLGDICETAVQLSVRTVCKSIAISHCCRGDLVGRTIFWNFLSGLLKLEQRAKKLIELRGEYVG